jgi:hypothetical protein
MLHIELKYVNLISSRLRGWTYMGNGKSRFNHSCERADSNKKRAYMLNYKGHVFMKCHHCGVSVSLPKFLAEIDPNLAAEFRMEMFREGVYTSPKPAPEPVKPPVTKPRDGLFDGLVSFKELARTHPARQYLVRRQIPENKMDLFYLCPKFYSWAGRIEDSFLKFKEQVPRLVLPLYDQDRALIGFSCRAFGREEPKYINLKVDKSKEFIFGLDVVDVSKPIIAVEGQIDSLFLENSIAVGSANYDLDFVNSHDNVIIVPDNDFRRNKSVCDQIRKAIQRGRKIALLPAHYKKDINDIVKKDKIPPEELVRYILSHQKMGTEALLELTLEKKC